MRAPLSLRHWILPLAAWTGLAALIPLAHAAPPIPLFDGKTTAGWEGDTTQTWRVEDGALTAGTLEKKQAKNDFLATVREFENFDLSLQWKLEGTQGFVNGGVQFRSQRIPNNHEVRGYQADLGAGYDGALYDESRRGMLQKPSKEVYEKARKPLGEWNDYRIRAEGARIQIWLNGVLTADYLEKDPGIPRSGMIAIQIHGGATSIVRYKNLVLEELPPSPAPETPTPTSPKASTPPPATPAPQSQAHPQGATSRIAQSIPARPTPAPFPNAKFEILKDDVVVFAGSENMVQEQHVGALEGRLAQHWQAMTPRFRHMSWEGDTVFRQNRMMQWGSWPANLEAAGATVVVAWFGQVEALDPTKSVADFSRSYGVLLDEFTKQTPRIVLIGPPPFEKPASSLVPDNTRLNPRIAQLNEAVRQLASQRGLPFVDLTQALSIHTGKTLTRNGMHFTESGLEAVGAIIANTLGATTPATQPLQAAIVEKNRLWFDTWRCMNWAFAYGDRTNQSFAKAQGAHPSLVDELQKFQPLLQHAESTVHALSQGKTTPAPLSVQVPRADPPAPSPDEQMSRFKIRDGFSVNLFADESLGVVRPIQIRWDARGRLWVACTPAYPQLQPGEHGHDYILILEDTNGDGRADKSTRFAEHLTMPMGFEFAPQSVGGGLYVCESTQLVHLPDSNQDDQADGRSVVLSGFGTGDTHQDANSLRWGPDGCLWFSQGFHIWSYVETPYGLAELNRSGLWRFNPRTHRLDSFLNESGAGLNCWGTAWDDYGQMFHGSGANTQIWHSTPALIPTLHPLALPTSMANSRGKSMEPEFLSSSHLPEELQGALLKSTFYTSQIQLYRLKDSGSSFVSKDLGDLLSGGNEFRPVETRGGPDGAIYVCDWLNPVIGHYQASYRDPRRDLSHGRIWRITANQRPLVPRPALGGKTAAELLPHLASPERWERDTAKFTLYRLDSPSVLAATRTALTSALSSNHTRLLYELSGVLAAHESSSLPLVEHLLRSPDFRERAWATRLLGLWANHLENPLPLLQRAATDDHPRVRLEAIVAAAWMPARWAPEALQIASLALDHPIDPPIQYALTQCIHALAPHWRPALDQGKLQFEGRPHALTHILTTLGDASLLPHLRKLVESPNLPPAQRIRLLETLAATGGPTEAEYALALAPDSQPVLKVISAQASLKNGKGYARLVEQLLQSPHGAARIAGCQIVATTSGEKWGPLPEISALVAHTSAPTAERSIAMAALAKLRSKEALPTLLAFADSPDADLRNGALAAAASIDSEAVSAPAARLLAGVHSTKEVAGLIAPILNRNEGGNHLARAIRVARLSPDCAKLTLQWMAESGRDDQSLREALQEAAGLRSPNTEYSESLVKRLVANALAQGSATEGESIFRAAQTTCMSCHKVGNAGGILGPDLSAIGRAMTPEAIVESVWWPKRQVKEGYMLTQITTKDGQSHQGYKASETPDSVTLKDLAGNPTSPIPKNKIATRSDSGTLMPDGLMASLSETQQLHLLRYLFQLGK
jgi:putative heme-binding domain-containing protein